MIWGPPRSTCRIWTCRTATTRPHITTTAHVVSTLGPDLVPICAAVLAVCDRQGLIGRELFAIDGVKLPLNALRGQQRRERLTRDAN